MKDEIATPWFGGIDLGSGESKATALLYSGPNESTPGVYLEDREGWVFKADDGRVFSASWPKGSFRD